MTLRERLEAYTTQLEQPVFRPAIYQGEYVQGRHEGEDNERALIASQLRNILQEEDTQ